MTLAEAKVMILPCDMGRVGMIFSVLKYSLFVKIYMPVYIYKNKNNLFLLIGLSDILF
jgi:hypothetical protein